MSWRSVASQEDLRSRHEERPHSKCYRSALVPHQGWASRPSVQRSSSMKNGVSRLYDTRPELIPSALVSSPPMCVTRVLIEHSVAKSYLHAAEDIDESTTHSLYHSCFISLLFCLFLLLYSRNTFVSQEAIAYISTATTKYREPIRLFSVITKWHVPHQALPIPSLATHSWSPCTKPSQSRSTLSWPSWTRSNRPLSTSVGPLLTVVLVPSIIALGLTVAVVGIW
jgi:hypothetical protein